MAILRRGGRDSDITDFITAAEQHLRVSIPPPWSREGLLNAPVVGFAETGGGGGEEIIYHY